MPEKIEKQIMKKDIYQRRNATVLQEFHAQDLGDSLAALPKKPETREETKKGEK